VNGTFTLLQQFGAMMTYDTQILLPVAVAISICVVVAAYLKARSRRHRERLIELTVAHQALEAHYSAMKTLCSDGALSAPLLTMLVGMSHGLSSHRVAQYIVSEFTKGSLEHKRRTSSGDVDRELENLRKTRIDLYGEFEKAMKSGLIALLLRWPDTASAFKAFMAQSASDERVEVEATTKISRYVSKMDHKMSHSHSDMHDNGMVAA
jgi:hypothetical protein